MNILYKLPFLAEGALLPIFQCLRNAKKLLLSSEKLCIGEKLTVKENISYCCSRGKTKRCDWRNIYFNCLSLQISPNDRNPFIFH